MTLRQYLILMSLGTVVCSVAWVYVLVSVDPDGARWPELLFFYVSLFMAITGLVSVVGFLIRKLVMKSDEIVFHHVKRTFRQALFASSSVIIILLMAHGRVLTWWNSLLLILFFIFLESIVFTQRKYSNRDDVV